MIDVFTRKYVTVGCTSSLQPAGYGSRRWRTCLPPRQRVFFCVVRCLRPLTTVLLLCCCLSLGHLQWTCIRACVRTRFLFFDKSAFCCSTVCYFSAARCQGPRALVRWIRLRINAHKLSALAIAGGSPEGVLPMKRLDCRRTWVFFQTRHLQLTARSSDCRHFTFACFRQYNEADGFVTSRRCCYACNTLIIVTLIIVIIVTLGFRL